MKRIVYASTVLASIVLVGCAGGTPDCGDTDTLSLIGEAIEMEVEKYATQTNLGTEEEFLGILDTYEISNIRTLDYDKKVDSYRCDARITYVYHDRERSVDFNYRIDIDQVSGNVLIEYQNKMLNPILGYAMGF